MAESILTKKIIANGVGIQPWSLTVKKIGAKLRKTISEIAGKNALVIISPAVIQGAENITDKVLIRLGLPTNIPEIMAPPNAVIPFFLHSYQKNESNLGWMMP